VLDLAIIGIGGDENRITRNECKFRERQIDGHFAPGVQREIPGSCRRDRNDRPPGETCQRNYSIARNSRTRRRDVGRHGDDRTVFQGPQRREECISSASISPAIASSSAADCRDAELLQKMGDDLAIAMTSNHSCHVKLARVEVGKHHELPVPHRHDEGDLGTKLVEKIWWFVNGVRGFFYGIDQTGNNAACHFCQQFRFSRWTSHFEDVRISTRQRT